MAFKSRSGHCLDPSLQLLQLHNLPADWARELFKHPTDSARIVVQILKKFVLGLEFSGGDVIMLACLHDFMAEVTWHWWQPNWPTFWLKVFMESRLSSESLEPLIGFLAYLEPKLWLKNKNWKKLYTHKRWPVA